VDISVRQENRLASVYATVWKDDNATPTTAMILALTDAATGDAVSNVTADFGRVSTERRNTSGLA
jgi:hypothetical protein